VGDSLFKMNPMQSKQQIYSLDQEIAQSPKQWRSQEKRLGMAKIDWGWLKFWGLILTTVAA